MSFWSDLWDEALAAGGVASSAAWNRTRKALATQIEDALYAHGDGVVGEDDFTVTAGAGLTVNIAAGRAVAQTTKGFVMFRGASSYNLTGLPANDTSYIFVGAVIAADPSTNPDSRMDNSIAYAHSTSATPPSGHILIATVVTGGASVTEITDSRTFIRGQEALNAIDAITAITDALEAGIATIKDQLGTDYWTALGVEVEGNDSISDRLTDLESAEGGVIYWGGLEKASDDPTTIAEYIAALLSGGSEDPGDTPSPSVQLPSDLEIANHLRLTLRLMHALPEVEETQKFAYYFVPGISDNSLYDAVNTTATVDPVEHTIG